MVLPQSVEKLYYGIGNSDGLTEIRLRVNEKIVFCFGKREKIFDEVFSAEEAKRFFALICDGAPYSRIKEQRAGFITADGCRIGFCGSYAFTENEMKHIEKITSFCIRIPHEIKGCAGKVYSKLFDRGCLLDTLIVSPPGCGKTTMLRDTVRLLSLDGFNVAVADEREEISGTGIDLGMRCDIMHGVKKSVAVTNMIRSMCPDVIAADEIGTKEDIAAIEDARRCGTAVIATAHGKSIEDAVSRLKTEFDRYIILKGTGNVVGVFGKDGNVC